MEWLVLKNRRHEGPYKEADLRRLLAEGKILVDDYVVSWRQAEAGELNYIPLRQVLGLQATEVPVAVASPGESPVHVVPAVTEAASPEAIPVGLLEAFDSSDLVPVKAGPDKPSAEELAVPRLESVANHPESTARAAKLGTLARFQRGFGLTVAAVFLALLVGAYVLLKKNPSGAPRLNAAASRAAPVAPRPPATAAAAASAAVSRGPLNLPAARPEPTPHAPEPSPEPQPPAYAESPQSMPPLPMSDNLAAQEVERLHLPQGQAVESRFPSSTGGPGGAEAMIMPYPGQPPMPGADGNAPVDPYAAAYGGYPQGYLPAQGEAVPTPPEYAPPGDQAPPPAAGYPNPPQEY